MTTGSERRFIGAILSTSLACTVACGGGGAVPDASVDARKDQSAQVVDAWVIDAGVDHAVHSPPNDGDAGAVERHFIDAAVVCEGGAGWGPCMVTDAAELACDASTDCTWQSAGGTCCGVPTFGVNKSAPFVGCVGLPCPPPKEPQPGCLAFYTQDCRAVDAAADIVVECVNHRCMTRAGSN